MENNINTFEGVNFTKISPEAIAADSWFNSWKEDMLRFYHSLFGYRKDPARVGLVRVLTPLTVQVVSREPNARKTFLQ